ncbi:MAG TPA: S46 family peptidase [Myxococcota bacterium]
MRFFTPTLAVALVAAAVVATTATTGAHADEGMWLLNELPKPAIEKSTGVKVDDAWVTRVQRGALRLANGCSASFVGRDGLVLTNHHCVRSCLEDLSVNGKDLLNQPFVAKTAKDELRCTKFELNQLQQIDDVTAAVLKATANLTGQAYADALKAEKTKIESACSNGDSTLRCEVITLFDGGRFHLYKQRRFNDVRLVLAPEFPMAAFGGDPDNFSFPRTGFDAAFLRVWVGDQPFSTTDALKFAATPVKEGDAVFVAGHPGGTERTRTVAQLAFQRDVALPWNLLNLAEQRGRLDEWMKAVPARQVRGKARLRTIENGLKALRGRHETLARAGFFAERGAAEDAMKRNTPSTTQAFADIEAANRTAATLWPNWRLYEVGEAFGGELFPLARLIVRAQTELKLPDNQRLTEFTSARLPALLQKLQSTNVVVVEDEIALLSWSLNRLRNLKGADDPLVKRLLEGRAPEVVAKQAITTTKLRDVKLRTAAFNGDAKAIATLGNDPLLLMAFVVDATARQVRTQWETEVEGKETKAGEVLATARRGRAGGSYPDATFSLRLSFGRLAGTTTAPALTTFADLQARSTTAAPYLLSPSWKKALPSLSPATPMNLSTTNDIIGGNSGSPLLDKNGDVVGLVFDGNLASLGGRYVYEAETNRAVAVSAEAIKAALKSIYADKGSARVLAELEAR